MAKRRRKPPIIERSSPCVVRSDGRSLHVDFENVTDRLMVARNAGVLMDWGTRAVITNDFAYRGRRCAYVASHDPGQQTRLQLVCAWDAPEARDGAVLEFVYRPVRDEPVELVNWPIVRCAAPGGVPGAFERQYVLDPVFGADAEPVDDQPISRFELEKLKILGYDEQQISQMQESSGPARPVALELRAHGQAAGGTYRVDVVPRGQRVDNVIESLPQVEWTRFVLHRRGQRVDLFAGPPDGERFVGSYPDMLPGGKLYEICLGNPDEPAARGSGYWDAFRLGRPLGSKAKVAPAEPPIAHVGLDAPAPPRTLALGSEKHLFIDDWSVWQTSNIRRTFHRPRKHDRNPLIMPDKPWEHALYLLGGVEKQRDGTLRMWYFTHDPTPGNRKNAYTCLATSEDGLRWHKPALDMYEVRGSRQNNVVIVESGTYSIILTPNDPRPDFRYKAHCRWLGTSGWRSADGVHWLPCGVLARQSLDASSFHYDPVRDVYIGTIKMGLGGRRHRGYIESKDFIKWTDTYLMYDTDCIDARGDEIYAMQIWRYESLYLATVKMYHTDATDTCDIHLAVSHSAKHWQRPYRPLDGPAFTSDKKDELDYADPHVQPFIPTGPPGTWDYGNLDVATTPPIRIGDELHFYYSGRSHSHSQRNPKGSGLTPGSIGLATLRVDGFVCAEADRAGGRILTRPLRLDGRYLYLNADARGGAIHVEVVDVHGRAIGPYSLPDARTVRSDHVRVRCRWKQTADLTTVAGRTVRLKFHLTGAKLYAFWTE